MANNNYTDLDRAVGLSEYKNAIKVSASIWEKDWVCRQVEMNTTVRAFKKAEKSKVRYSTENCVKLLVSNDKKALDALLYRAKVSEQKDLAIGTKNACHIGIKQM